MSGVISLAQNSSFLPMWFNNFFPTLCIWNGPELDSSIMSRNCWVSAGQHRPKGASTILCLCIHDSLSIATSCFLRWTYPMGMPENQTEMKDRQQRPRNLHQEISWHWRAWTQETASQQTWFHQLRNELMVIVNGDAPGLCGWPDPGPFACTALPMTASENVWECAAPRPTESEV